MRIPHKFLKDARDHARLKANETGEIWYVNRLASSGPMHYEVSDEAITNTSFGGGLVSVIHPDPKPLPPITENRIVKIEASLLPNGYWDVAVTKEFAPEYGGGRQTFHEVAGSAHNALDVARGMVTLSPGQRSDLDEVNSEAVPTGREGEL